MDTKNNAPSEVTYSLLLPKKLHTRVKVLCAEAGISIKDYLTDLIEHDLEHHILPINRSQQ